MQLSELKTGEKAVIAKVSGHGSFRKRLIEMGFIRGKAVRVILNAPLKDPIEYEILGYKVSLRREEASKIEVISEEEAKQHIAVEHAGESLPAILDREISELAEERGHSIRVALVGNPNCGKTSLFNIASGSHEHVGTYSGVTVDAKEGKFEFKGYKITLVDLPGTYSLSAYSPEELYVRKNLLEKTPDIVLNVVDASNIERNLYLTAQLIDNFIYQPLIYSTSIKAHPLEIFIVLLMAGHIGGTIGMLVAIPAYTVLRVIAIRFFYQYKVIQRLVPDLSEEDKIIENID